MRQIWKEKSPDHALKMISQFFTDKELRKYIDYDHHEAPTFFDTGTKLNNSNDALNRLLAIDYKTFLLDNNLAKVDRATMSCGLEGREPFLDHRIIEFVSRLPSDYKIRNSVNKSLLKDIVHKYIPKEIMDRPRCLFLLHYQIGSAAN